MKSDGTTNKKYTIIGKENSSEEEEHRGIYKD